MTFAAIDYLSISINLLLVVFVIICFLMTLIILMQRPKQEGLGAAFGAGVTDQVFGARTTNVLQRGTVYLGSAFFLLSLALAILIGQQNKQKTLIGPASAKAAVVAPATPKVDLKNELPAEPAPVTPATPDAQIPAPAPAPEATTPATPAPAPESAPAPAEPAPAAPNGSTEKPEGQ